MRALLILSALLAGPAFGDEPKRLSNAELYPPLPGVEYFCTDATGTRYELGQSICITASCKTWMAVCDMSLNNPTWRKTRDGCPITALDRLERLAALG